MKTKLTREKGSRYCTVEINLENGRLSITGEAGRVVRTKQAKSEAIAYWRTFFEDSPEELFALNQRCKKNFRSATSAAKYVLLHDGEFHGLDVRASDRPGIVYVGESWGQIVEEIKEFFPEIAPLLKWHLNDLHAECEHQEARGETYQSHPDAMCPDCGYKLGSAWLKRALPGKVVAYVEKLCSFASGLTGRGMSEREACEDGFIFKYASYETERDVAEAFEKLCDEVFTEGSHVNKPL